MSIDSDSCSANFLYLETSSLDPLQWSCKPCPEGADCSGARTWADVSALFGWWPIPFDEQYPQKDGTVDQFAPCMSPPACLGSNNPALTRRYPEANANTNVSCAVQKGFLEGARLCHRCKVGFKRKGLNQCEACPDSAQTNVAVVILGLILMVLILVYLIYSSIDQAGKTFLSAQVQKIMLNYLQVSTLFESFPLQWPAAVETMFQIQGATSTLGEHLVNPDCLAEKLSPSELYYAKQIGFAILPFGVVLFSFAFWQATGKYRQIDYFAKRKTRKEVTLKDKFVITLTSSLYLLYPTLCKNSVC